MAKKPQANLSMRIAMKSHENCSHENCSHENCSHENCKLQYENCSQRIAVMRIAV